MFRVLILSRSPSARFSEDFFASSIALATESEEGADRLIHKDLLTRTVKSLALFILPISIPYQLHYLPSP